MTTLLSAIWLAGIFLVLAPKPAHAGFLSFLDNFFNNEDQTVVYNSQTAPLLSAPQATDPLLGTGGPSVDIVDGKSILPSVGPMGSIADVETYKLDQISTYQVVRGDTISKVAAMFDVDVDTILWANDLKKGDALKVGDILVILPISGIQYTVKKGDTLESLAKKFKSDAGDIASFNDLDPEKSLTVGISIIIPEAKLPNSNTTPTPSTRTTYARGANGPDLGGYYSRPIDGGRNSRATKSNPHGLHGYNGIDLASSCGLPVFASASGDVIVAKKGGWNGGYGNYVVISHPNGTQTLYGHLSTVIVGPGWHVARGMQIGTIGSTGNSTGCHVHFEIRGAKNPF